MAKVQIFPGNPDTEGAFTDFRSSVLAGHGGNVANFTETNGDDTRLVLKGKDFYYEDGELVSGTVTSMALFTFTGAKMASITGFSLNVDRLQPQDEIFWAYRSMEIMMKGKNQMIGSAGDDYLEGFGGKDSIKGLGGDDRLAGGARDDRFSGGAGADQFYFFQGSGHDIISDFQSDGADLSTHDLIRLETANYEVRKAGNDVVIETEFGDTIRLLNFKKAELDAGDIGSVF